MTLEERAHVLARRYWGWLKDEAEKTGFDPTQWCNTGPDTPRVPTSDWYHSACGAIQALCDLLGVTEEQLLRNAGVAEYANEETQL